MHVISTSLLRRTVVTLGAALGLASLPAMSQGTVSLSTGASCQYTQMVVQPNGSIQVTCQTTNPQPTVANFAVSAPGSGAAGSSGSATITRSGGPAEALSASYTVGGSGCGASSGAVTLLAGGAQTVPYTLGASGSCTIAISAPSGHTASPSAATVAVQTVDPGVPGCPAPEATANGRSLDYGPVDQLRMKSGHIAYYPVISLPDQRFSSVEFTQGQQPNTPGSVTTEFSVSRCPGTISNAVPDCYYKSALGGVNSNKITIYTRPKPEWGWTSQAAMAGYGCLADATQGQWYVNVRWTYPACVWGENNCGFSMQWAIGAW